MIQISSQFDAFTARGSRGLLLCVLLLPLGG
jgi:hypothetical protein